jgi:hypothetical protein
MANWPKTKQRKLLSVDELIKRAEEWDKRYLTATVHSLELYDGDDADDLQRQFLSKRSKGAFKLTNPYAKRLWLPKLMDSFLKSRQRFYGRSWEEDLRSGKVVCALVTFTHEGWACADTNIQFDLGAAKKKVRNALAGLDYIANFEPAVYKNENWLTNGVEGKLISFHCHAVVWVGSASSMYRLASRIHPRFRPILGNGRGVHTKMIRSEVELANTIPYLAKLPAMGKRTELTKTRKKRQCNSKMTFSSRRNLFHALKGHSTFDTWLAGGEGVRILREPRVELQRKYKAVGEL